MSYQQNEKVQPCKACAANKVTTLIQWRPNPEKIGQTNPSTGRPFMRPWEVNINDWHKCQFFKQTQAQQTNQYYDAKSTSSITPTGGGTTARPQFTPNNQTFENIETNTDRIVSQNEKIIELLELIAGEKIREQGMPRANEIPQEHKNYPDLGNPVVGDTYQNNTGYRET